MYFFVYLNVMPKIMTLTYKANVIFTKLTFLNALAWLSTSVDTKKKCVNKIKMSMLSSQNQHGHGQNITIFK